MIGESYAACDETRYVGVTGGKDYKLNDTYFPTIDKENPYKLSPREEEVMEILTRYFLNSEKIKHIEKHFEVTKT